LNAGDATQASLRDFQRKVAAGHIQSWRPSAREKVIWATTHAPATVQISARAAASLKLYSLVSGRRQALFSKSLLDENHDPKSLFDAALNDNNMQQETLPRPRDLVFQSTHCSTIYVPQRCLLSHHEHLHVVKMQLHAPNESLKMKILQLDCSNCP